jgi:hypothetical protein
MKSLTSQFFGYFCSGATTAAAGPTHRCENTLRKLVNKIESGIMHAHEWLLFTFSAY